MNEAEFKRECFRLQNEYRKKHGAKPLKWSDSLAKAAEKHAEDMAAKNYFSHDSINGIPWFKRIQKVLGRRGRGIGLAENIAYGQDTADEVVRQWIDSPAHERNMRDKSMRKGGIGFAKRGNTEYWVTDFGTA